MVGLRDIAVLMGFASGIGGRGHAIMGHQGQVAVRPAALAVRLNGLNRRREVVSAVVLGHAADLPEAELQPLGQRLEALGETEGDRLDVGVGQHEVEKEMREGCPGDGDRQFLHMGEVGLATLARLVDLRKDDVMVGAVEGTPGRDMALEATQLAGGIALRSALREDGKERFGLKRRVTLELLLDPGPVGEKGIGACAVVTRLAHATGEGGRAQVFAGGGHAHPGAGGGLLDGLALRAGAEHQLYLIVGLHGSSF